MNSEGQFDIHFKVCHWAFWCSRRFSPKWQKLIDNVIGNSIWNSSFDPTHVNCQTHDKIRFIGGGGGWTLTIIAICLMHRATLGMLVLPSKSSSWNRFSSSTPYSFIWFIRVLICKVETKKIVLIQKVLVSIIHPPLCQVLGSTKVFIGIILHRIEGKAPHQPSIEREIKYADWLARKAHTLTILFRQQSNLQN